MQSKGHVYRRGAWWILRFRQTINEQGTLRTVQRAEKLVPVSSHYKTKSSLRELIAEKLSTVNKQNSKPKTVVSLGDFVSNVYWPTVTVHKRPSTANNYKNMWETHLRARCETFSCAMCVAAKFKLGWRLLPRTKRKGAALSVTQPCCASRVYSRESFRLPNVRGFSMARTPCETQRSPRRRSRRKPSHTTRGKSSLCCGYSLSPLQPWLRLLLSPVAAVEKFRA